VTSYAQSPILRRGTRRFWTPVLFSYRSRLRFVAVAKTGVCSSEASDLSGYPRYFLVDLPTLRSCDVPMCEVESRLRSEAGLNKSLGGRGWTLIPDNEDSERVIELLAPGFRR